MTDYGFPDNWVVVDLHDHHRLLCGWSGGYTSGDSWRMNSGIVEFVDKGDYFDVIGASGSVYHVRKHSYMVRMNTASVLRQLEQDYGATVMPEDTDWINFNWNVD